MVWGYRWKTPTPSVPDLSEKLWHSKDAIEGPLAFSQKRKPNWTGE